MIEQIFSDLKISQNIDQQNLQQISVEHEKQKLQADSNNEKQSQQPNNQAKQQIRVYVTDKTQDIQNASYKLKINQKDQIQKKGQKSTYNTTNAMKATKINNPQDKAMQLVLRMSKMRMQRQLKQEKLIAKIKKQRQKTINKAIEMQNLSQMIDRQNYIKKGKNLRQNLYYLPKNILQKVEKKMDNISIIADKQANKLKELKILEYSKKMTSKYYVKKLIFSILDEIINHSVDLYEKKYKFFFRSPAIKISQIMNTKRNIEHNLNNSRIKGSRMITVSRVIDVNISGVANQDQGVNQQQLKSNSQQNEKSSNKSNDQEQVNQDSQKSQNYDQQSQKKDEESVSQSGNDD